MKKKFIIYLLLFFVAFPSAAQSNKQIFFHNKTILDSVSNEFAAFDCKSPKRITYTEKMMRTDRKLLTVLNKARGLKTMNDFENFCRRYKSLGDTSNRLSNDSNLAGKTYVAFSHKGTEGNIRILINVFYYRKTNAVQSISLSFMTRSHFFCDIIYEGRPNYISYYVDFNFIKANLLKYIKFQFEIDKSGTEVIVMNQKI